MITLLTILTFVFLSIALFLGVYCYLLNKEIQQYKEEYWELKNQLSQWKYELTTKTTTNYGQNTTNQGRD